ncbi:MAG TPA: DUF2934 domain-containing protein [Verrucomicrobiae bacterium]
MNSEENRLETESNNTTYTPTHDEIAKEAYRLYEQNGHQEGHDLEYWLEAETTLGIRGEAKPEKVSMTPMEFAEAKEAHEGHHNEKFEQTRKNAATRQEIRQQTSAMRDAPRQSQRPQRRSA